MRKWNNLIADIEVSGNIDVDKVTDVLLGLDMEIGLSATQNGPQSWTYNLTVPDTENHISAMQFEKDVEGAIKEIVEMLPDADADMVSVTYSLEYAYSK